jgi:hypothetical protein
VSSRVSSGQALLTALAGLTAYEGGLTSAAELMSMAGDSPDMSFVAALAVASRLGEEVRRLGGDPDALRLGIYDKASAMAFSS